jgi:hypothetical protein
MSDYCTYDPIRIDVTDEQIRTGKAPCPKCGRVLRIVPNLAQKKASLRMHVKPKAKKPLPASVTIKHNRDGSIHMTARGDVDLRDVVPGLFGKPAGGQS